MVCTKTSHELFGPIRTLAALVVWGSEDSVFPLEQGRRLADTIAGAELLNLKGARHPCYLDQPELFHERVLAFALER